MNLQQLEYIVALDKHRHFQRAAEACGVSQPTLSALVQKLEERNLHCWYAPRNVKGRYAKAIAHGISHSKVFLLLLTPRSAVSEAVLNEVEMAQNFAKNGDCAVIQPVCAEAFDFDSPDFQEMMYYIRRRHFVSAEDSRDFSELADRIIKSQP